jgi:hypothetical protein
VLMFSSLFRTIFLLSYLRYCFPLCILIQGLSLSLPFVSLLSFLHYFLYFAICWRILYYPLPFLLVGWELRVVKSWLPNVFFPISFFPLVFFIFFFLMSFVPIFYFILNSGL